MTRGVASCGCTKRKQPMSQLDQIVASVEDSILPGMNYSLNNRKGASFLHQRVLSTFFPTTSGLYSPASQRSVKIMFSDSGNGFLDLSTIRISLKIRNTGTRPIRLTGRHSRAAHRLHLPGAAESDSRPARGRRSVLRQAGGNAAEVQHCGIQLQQQRGHGGHRRQWSDQGSTPGCD